MENLELQDMFLYVDEKMEQEWRDSTGSFYTPYEMARWVVWRSVQALTAETLGKASSDWVQHLIPQTLHTELHPYLPKMPELSPDEGDALWSFLTSRWVADIAAGSGVFLIAWMDQVSDAGRRLAQLDLIEKNALKIGMERAAGRLLAVDIQDEPLRVFQMAMAKRFNFSPTTLNRINVLQANALEDGFLETEPVVAALASGGFDLILGNPPYIGEKGNRAVFDAIRPSQLYQRYYTAKMDYFYFFIHRAQELLSSTGVLAYLVTNYFVTADGASTLREELKQKMRFIAMTDFGGYSLFKSAKGHHSMVIIAEKADGGGEQSENVEILRVSGEKGLREPALYRGLYGGPCDQLQHYQKRQDRLYLDNGYMSLLGEREDRVYQKLVACCQYVLEDLCLVNQGIVSGLDSSREDGRGVFVIDRAEGEVLDPAGVLGLAKPFFKNSDIDSYWVEEETGKRILYIDGTEDEASMEQRCPHILEHLAPHRNILMRRRECQMGRRPWYALQWPRNAHVFEGEKLVVPHRSPWNRFGYSKEAFYGSADIYYIAVRRERFENHSVLLKYLLALLNSRIYNFLLVKSGKKKGSMLELYATPLKKLPVYLPSKNEIDRIAARVDQALKYRKSDDHQAFIAEQDGIESDLAEFYGVDTDDQAVIEDVVRSWRKEK